MDWLWRLHWKLNFVLSICRYCARQCWWHKVCMYVLVYDSAVTWCAMNWLVLMWSHVSCGGRSSEAANRPHREVMTKRVTSFTRSDQSDSPAADNHMDGKMPYGRRLFQFALLLNFVCFILEMLFKIQLTHCKCNESFGAYKKIKMF